MDLNKLLEQRLTTALQKSLDSIINKFESGPLCGIMVRVKHALLSQWR